MNLCKIKKNKAAAKIEGVSSNAIRKWRKIEFNLEEVSNPETKIILHPERFKKIRLWNRKRNLKFDWFHKIVR